MREAPQNTPSDMSRDELLAEIERLRWLVEAQPQVPWEADAQGNITDFSQRWLDLTGLTREQAMGNGWINAPHPEDLPRMVEAWTHSLATGVPYDIEHRIRTADGSYRWMRSRAKARRGADGEIIAWYGTAENVHERRAAAERLAEAAEAVPALIASFDTDLKILSCNRRLAEWFGRARAEIVGRTVRDVVGKSVFAALQPYLGRALAGERTQYEQWLSYHGRERRFMRTTYVPFHDSDGSVAGIDAHIVDDTEARLAQEALSDAKARTDAILGSADVATWVLDVQNDRLYADRNLARFFAVDEETAQGGPAAAYVAKIHLDDQPQVREALGRASTEGVPYDVEFRVVAGGKERWVTARGLPERDEAGRIVRLPGVVVDVTQLKRAQEQARETAEALRESESQYRILVESVPEIAWTARPDGHLDYYNERWYEYTGRRRGEQGDTSWTPLIHPDDLNATYEAFRRSIETGEPYEMELRLRGVATNDFRWFLARARPMRDQSGEIVRWFGVTSDIDDQKRTQGALALASRFGNALTQELDPNRVIQTLSDVSTEAVGAEFGSFFYTKPEEERDADGSERFGLYVLSGASREVFANFPPVRSTPLFAPTFSGVGAVRSDDVSKDPRFSGMPQGHLPVRSYLATPVRGRDGSVLGALLFGHSESCRFTEDHQRLVESFASQASVAYENAVLYERLREAKEGLERRVAERTEALTRANRDLNEFSYSVAHDLRAPLRAIVSTSRILLEDAAERLNEAEREALERQATNATRLAKIVDDLLGFARLANAEPRRHDLDMTDLARRAADDVRARREGACEVHVQEEMRSLGDPSLVGYLFTNLIDNACKFTKDKGRVSIGEQGGAFYVRDQGVGFDMRHAHKLFVAFERLVGQDAFEGTGVGLANVKRIVEKHGGRVWAESEPGKGATFWFTLASSLNG